MKQIFALFISLSLGLTMNAQSGMNPELLWKLGRVSLDDVSPDGKYALYGITTYDMGKNSGERLVYRVPTKGGTLERISEKEDGSESGAHFVGNSKTIAFMRKGQLYLKEWGGEEKPVTDIRDGIANAHLQKTKNGHLLIFSKKVPRSNWLLRPYESMKKANVRIYDDLMYRHWDNWQGEMTEHLCIADLPKDIIHPVVIYKDLMKGKDYAFPTPPFGGKGDYSIHPDGTHIAYVLKPETGVDFAQSTNTRIFLYDIENEATTEISGDNEGYDKYPKFSPDGKYLSWLSMPRGGFESDESHFVVFDLKQNKAHRTLADFWHSYDWADKKTVYITKDEKATIPVYKLNLSFGKNGVTAKSEAFATGRYNYGNIKAGKGTVVAERMDMNHPTELFTFSKRGEAEALSSVNTPIFEHMPTSDIREEWVTTSDGKKMLVWVILPPDFDESKQYPALLYCQGGPQSAVSQFYSFRWNFQLMASQGYVVIAPNRRGLPGFGKDWNDDISGDWGGQPITDYLTAVDEMAKKSYIDENRIGAVGASYGGYSVYQLAGVHEGRFKTFISHCGLFHMESWYGTTEELFFADWDLGGSYWDKPTPKSYLDFSPHSKVDQWDTPIMVIHGEKDFRVPVEQGLQAFQAAKIRGIDSRLVLFPDEGHWVLQPQNAMVWQTEFFMWLNKYLK